MSLKVRQYLGSVAVSMADCSKQLVQRTKKLVGHILVACIWSYRCIPIDDILLHSGDVRDHVSKFLEVALSIMQTD